MAEDAGFDVLGTGDSQSLWADPFVTMTVAAMHTRRPRVGVSVSNPVTRHPAVAASAMVAIQQLAGGRAYYGIGSGDSAVFNIGERPAKLAEVEEYGRAVKGLCAGETVQYRGKELVLRWLTEDAKPVPLWMAPEGPRTQRLAGQIADAVILSCALTRERFERSLANVRAGAEAAGRSMDEIEIWCRVDFYLAETEQAGLEGVRFALAGAAHRQYQFSMEGKGVPEELAPKLRELVRRYDSSHHASPLTAHANAALVEELGLVDWMAAQSAIVGPPERLVERIHEVAEAGVRNLMVAQWVPDPFAFMRTFAEQVMPAFR